MPILPATGGNDSGDNNVPTGSNQPLLPLTAAALGTSVLLAASSKREEREAQAAARLEELQKISIEDQAANLAAREASVAVQTVATVNEEAPYVEVSTLAALAGVVKETFTGVWEDAIRISAADAPITIVTHNWVNGVDPEKRLQEIAENDAFIEWYYQNVYLPNREKETAEEESSWAGKVLNKPAQASQLQTGPIDPAIQAMIDAEERIKQENIAQAAKDEFDEKQAKYGAFYVATITEYQEQKKKEYEAKVAAASLASLNDKLTRDENQITQNMSPRTEDEQKVWDKFIRDESNFVMPVEGRLPENSEKSKALELANSIVDEVNKGKAEVLNSVSYVFTSMTDSNINPYLTYDAKVVAPALMDTVKGSLNAWGDIVSMSDIIKNYTFNSFIEGRWSDGVRGLVGMFEASGAIALTPAMVGLMAFDGVMGLPDHIAYVTGPQFVLSVKNFMAGKGNLWDVEYTGAKLLVDVLTLGSILNPNGILGSAEAAAVESEVSIATKEVGVIGEEIAAEAGSEIAIIEGMETAAGSSEVIAGEMDAAIESGAVIVEGSDSLLSKLVDLGLDNPKNITRVDKLKACGVTEENILNVIQEGKSPSMYIQKKILAMEEFNYLNDAQKLAVKSAINDGRIDVSTWTGKLSGDLKGLTTEEWAAVNRYMGNGSDVYRIPEDGLTKVADFVVDGTSVEFKGIKTNILENIKDQAMDYADESLLPIPEGKGADKLVLDCVTNGQDLTLDQAIEIANEIKLNYPEKTVEIWTSFGDIVK